MPRPTISITRLALIKDACDSRKPVSVGLLGNAAEVFPELLRRGVQSRCGDRPDLRP